MATITFTIAKSTDDLGKAEILIRFSVSREKRFRAKTGYFVPVNRWSKKNSITIPKIDTDERKMLVKLDDDLENLKKHLFNSFESTDIDLISKEWLVANIDMFKFPEKYKKVNDNFFKAFDDYLQAKKLSEGRVRAVLVLKRILMRFELFKQIIDRRFVLHFDYIDKYFLAEFEEYMINEAEYLKKHSEIIVKVPESRSPEDRGPNTITDKLKMLRAFLTWCVDSEIININPFSKYTIKDTVYGTPYYITIAERNKIYSHIFVDRPMLAIQRDIFVFQCLTGCRVGDLLSLKKSNVINGAIEYIARKTKNGDPITVRVPLNDQAKEIIKRYSEHKGDKLLPFISSQKYNKAIKEIFTEVEITRIVTILNPLTREQEQAPLNTVASSHLARRTFIGNLYKQVKDPNLVGSMSGHKEGSKAFARYRDIDDDIKSELVNLLL
ncbi:MAG: hypothetical protein BGP01_03365 [Paludibacter sp. 47-17]|nr:MAG: hypothetical protein BGP01_03365 [Paludibacter sp. 47-17]